MKNTEVPTAKQTVKKQKNYIAGIIPTLRFKGFHKTPHLNLTCFNQNGSHLFTTQTHTATTRGVSFEHSFGSF